MRRCTPASAEVLNAGAAAVVLGGDHSLSTPVLRAIADRYGADGYSVIHFDTHADTGLEMSEAPHGIPFSRAVKDGHLRGGNIIQIGLRGNWPCPEEFDVDARAGLPLAHDRPRSTSWHRRRRREAIARAAARRRAPT